MFPALMWLMEIWRYPVKSMSGEPLQSADLGPLGIPGDRVVHVENERGRVVTSRSRPLLLRHHAALGEDGEPRIDGVPWAEFDVSAAAGGQGARLVRHDGEERFDVLPLLVATDGAIAAFGYDHRRLRPNLVIGGVDGLSERDWEGRALQIGTARIGIVDLRERCIMTTFDPDTAEQDVEVLKKIHRVFDGTLALNCRVLVPGRVAVGDGVQLR